MYRIAVCDDEDVFSDLLCDDINLWALTESVNVEIKVFSSGEDLLEDIVEYGDGYHIIFLDIEMPRMNGIATAKEIRKINLNVTLIFVSQYDDYYKEAYEVHPYYFFRKPVEKEKMFSILNTSVKQNETLQQSFKFRYNKIYFSLYLRNVLYFSSDKRAINITCFYNKHYKFYGRLDEVEAELKTQLVKFIRIHKSFLVNRKYIAQYHYQYVVMCNHEVIPISVRKRKEMKLLQLFLFKEEDYYVESNQLLHGVTKREKLL